MIANGLKTLNGSSDISFEQLFIDVVATKTCSTQDMAEKTKLVIESVSQVS
jgi:hypothetical protein